MPIPDDALAALAARLGPRLSTRAADRAHHAGSESHHTAPPPDAVAWPEDAAEVATILAICNGHRVAVIGWGTGTSLEGHALATQGGLTVDLMRMDRVLDIRAEDFQATVQPGVTRGALNTALRATGLFFPVDPGADASLGGMAATRASGTTTVRYGTMRDNVLGLQVALADGRLIRTGTRARKSSAGYDLTALMVGSEGTLGLMTELTLRLHGQPEAVIAAVCPFPTLEAATACAADTIGAGIGVARIEFVDAVCCRAFNAAHGTTFPEAPHLFVEFHGGPEAVVADAARFEALAAGHGAEAVRRANDADARAALWRMRHGAYPAILALHPGHTAMTTDICVPISALPAAVAAASADLDAAGLPAAIVGHVGDGNFHASILLRPGDGDGLARAKAAATRMAERALAAGGTISGEHGIGVGKRPLMAAQHGPAWAVMGAIKAALDPCGILNPGKLLPDPEPAPAPAVGPEQQEHPS